MNKDESWTPPEPPCTCEVTAHGNVDDPNCPYHHPPFTSPIQKALDNGKQLISPKWGWNIPTDKLAGNELVEPKPKPTPYLNSLIKHCEFCDLPLDDDHPKTQLFRGKYHVSWRVLQSSPNPDLTRLSASNDAIRELYATAGEHGWRPDGVHPAFLRVVDWTYAWEYGETHEYILNAWMPAKA